MLSIFAPIKYHAQIREIIRKEDRLNELVRIVDYLEERPVPSGANLLVKQEEIWPLIDWHNVRPPYLLPENVPLDEAHLLGLVFANLGNYEKTHEYLAGKSQSLYLELDFINRLQQGIPISPAELVSRYTPFDEYRLMHNQAVIHHYAAMPQDFDAEKTQYFYIEAIQSAPNDEYRVFTARQYALLLIDLGETEKAVRLLKGTLGQDISEEARTELRHTLCQSWMQELSAPYDEALLGQLKDTLWKVLQAYEKQERALEQALVLTDAGIIANYSESWAESLGYFNRALAIFDEAGLPELAANVHYRKGVLLFTWAQNGNPQFYRSAAESYQKAVRVFSREAAPDVYAEIQHHLGIIYADIPDEAKKKSIWAAVSSSAFQEALGIYTKEAYPYEYAAVCNHYGNALTKYPAAVLSDNFEKALFYYQEALSVRTPEAYPLERCLSLLNYLQAQWNLGMPEDQFQEDRYLDMAQKAEEVLALSSDPQLQAEAREHLERLAMLKAAYA
ncbi:MAG: hypothetical protein KDD10_06275 [Phaeodactylibacter sp.]|nr:hypothetical protein [Phaeodactylibacter sp.]MCB9297424.1 hypothetical protein [Lewinellaceae bacterium]